MNLSEFGEALAQQIQDLPEERLRELANGKLDAVIKVTVSESIEESSRSLLTYAKRNMHGRLDEDRKKRMRFEGQLFSRWKAGFDLFEIFCVIALEAGISLDEKHGEQAKQDNDFIFAALKRIHAKACLTTSEVYALMRTGHASGAMARWRTLHELAVVAMFIRKHGHDAAERYLLHNAIESWKATSLYQRYHKRMKCDPIEQQEIDAVRSKRDELCQRYGAIYGNNYGWAASALGITDPKRQIKFAQIEQESGIDHLRPFYKMASHGIHSESKGVYWNLGTLGSSIVLAGPSNSGFGNAADASAISLHQCTICFLMTRLEVPEILTMKTMQMLVDEIGQTFLSIQEQLKREVRERESNTVSEENHGG